MTSVCYPKFVWIILNTFSAKRRHHTNERSDPVELLGLMMTSWYGDAFHIAGLLRGESIDHWWFLLTKGQWRGPLMNDLPVTCGAMTPMWHHCNIFLTFSFICPEVNSHVLISHLCWIAWFNILYYNNGICKLITSIESNKTRPPILRIVPKTQVQHGEVKRFISLLIWYTFGGCLENIISAPE